MSQAEVDSVVAAARRAIAALRESALSSIEARRDDIAREALVAEARIATLVALAKDVAGLPVRCDVLAVGDFHIDSEGRDDWIRRMGDAFELGLGGGHGGGRVVCQRVRGADMLPIGRYRVVVMLERVSE